MQILYKSKKLYYTFKTHNLNYISKKKHKNYFFYVNCENNRITMDHN